MTTIFGMPEHVTPPWLPTIEQPGPFEFSQDSAGDWRFHLEGGNHEVMAHGEGYTRPEDAERGAQAVVRRIYQFIVGGPDGQF